MGVPQTALIVDDENHVRLYIKMILKQLGVDEIMEAANGLEGVEIYREHKPDVVFLDVNMPSLDGIEALEQINGIDPDSIAIMLTSFASREIVESSAHHGAVKFIRKDMPKDDIIKIISETFAQYFE